MRKLLVFLSFLAIASSSFGQDSTSSKPSTREEYLQKSANQKTGAWILLGAGAAVLAITAVSDADFDILPVLVIGSGAAVLGSIPLFIAARKNKKRGLAMTANLEIQRSPVLTYLGASKPFSPGISIRLTL